MERAERMEQAVRAFIDAFEGRDLEACVGFFAEDAVVHFLGEDYAGHDALRGWLQERFDVNLRIVKVRGIQVEGEKAILRGELDSDRIRAWPASGITGVMMIQFDEDGSLFTDIQFGMGVLKRG